MGALLKRVKFIHYLTPEQWELLGERDRVAYEEGYIVAENPGQDALPNQISTITPGSMGAYI